MMPSTGLLPYDDGGGCAVWWGADGSDAPATHREAAKCTNRGPDGRCFSAWRDPMRYELVVQHGDNPEAQLRVPGLLLEESQGGSTQHMVADWLRAVHEYEGRR